MNQAKINELYERAHVVHEIRYEGSVVDPTIVAVHKQRVFDRNLFAELIVQECIEQGKQVQSQNVSNGSKDYIDGREMGIEVFINQIRKYFGVEE